jgi:hypothetical protein
MVATDCEKQDVTSTNTENDTLCSARLSKAMWQGSPFAKLRHRTKQPFRKRAVNDIYGNFRRYRRKTLYKKTRTYLTWSLVNDYPLGYSRVAVYMNSDINRHLCRRFGIIRNRLILWSQDEVKELEEKLFKLDCEDNQGDKYSQYSLRSRRYDRENEGPRNQLIKELQVKLKEYDELVMREHAMLQIGKPSKKSHRSYFNYMNNLKPLCTDEQDFILQEDDLLDLAQDSEIAWIGVVIDAFLAVTPKRILKVSIQQTNLEIKKRKQTNKADLIFNG